jgi:hypothetical protein
LVWVERTSNGKCKANTGVLHFVQDDKPKKGGKEGTAKAPADPLSGMTTRETRAKGEGKQI